MIASVIIVILLNLVKFLTANDCTSGSIRLVGGQTETEGRIEACYDGTNWATVCGEGFSIADGRVVCRHLGFPDDVIQLHSTDMYGEATVMECLYNVQCDGTENVLFSCNSQLGTQEDCLASYRSIGIQCFNKSAAECEEGSVRLVDGTANTGRMEYCYNGGWGTVCEERFVKLTTGYVACRQLGFVGIAGHVSSNLFGPGSNQNIWQNNFNCDGDEKMLSSCFESPELNFGMVDCDHTNDIGLLCSTSNACNEGSVRLIDGGSDMEGVVEVCFNGQWGTVCADSFWINEAKVVCKQLGVMTDILDIHNRGSAATQGSAVLNKVACNGSESDLLHCDFAVTVPGSQCILSDTFLKCHNDSGIECMHGSVRLVGGITDEIGRVEVCNNGRWGTVCADNEFGLPDGKVICKQLGFPGVAEVYGNAEFGEGSGSIWMESLECKGVEESLFECNSTFVGGHQRRCQHWQDAAVRCLVDCNDMPKVRLVHSTNLTTEGRVEVCVNSQWGTVCRDSFGSIEGTIVCNQLGFLALKEVYTVGMGYGMIWLDDVQCSGDEMTLLNCSEGASDNCDHTKDVGVKCLIKPECVLGSIQLANGNSNTTGRVEVCLDHQWITIDGRLNFGIKEGAVVCQQLGFSDIGIVYGANAFGSGSGYNCMHNIQCVGNEITLLNCTGESRYCDHLWDVGVKCLQYTGECVTGSVQLAGGNSSNTGRVEVCYDGQWGTVCDVHFTITDGRVVCKELGFFDILEVHSNAAFANVFKGIWLVDVNCIGTENSLLDCGSLLYSMAHDCQHYQDVGVTCSSSNINECVNGSVQLVDGNSIGTGRVEVCYNNRWGTVCDTDFGLPDGSVICKQLGFQGSVQIYENAAYGQGAGYIWLDDVQCTGNEETIFECGFNNTHNCQHTDDVGVMCFIDPGQCVNGSVQLVGSINRDSEGRVEVCYNGQWGTVCDHGFGINEGKVVCNQLGFKDVNEIYSEAAFGQGSGNIWLANVWCEGNEQTLLECNNSLSNGYGHECQHMDDVGLICSGTLTKPVTTSPLSTVYTTSVVHHSMRAAIETSSSALTSPALVAAIASVAFIVVVCFVCTVTLCCCIIAKKTGKKRKSTLQYHSMDFPRKSFQDSNLMRSLRSDHEYVEMSGKFNMKRKLSKVLLTSLIHPFDLKVVEKIGQGEFGIVYRGVYTKHEGSETILLPVAIKTLKGFYSKSNIDELIEEAEKMKGFDHLHVLTLTGICIGLLESPSIVMPFMSNGSLLSYLRKDAPNLTVSELADENVLFDTMKQLLSMCLQVAKGMDYLSEHNFIHRDLAARNCMISSEGIIKVADFGLAEEVYHTADYFKQDQLSDEPVKLPIKWMALESIHYGKFSSKTDVWSYGVLCWEVFSVGRSPYPGMGPQEVVQMLDNGERLAKPFNPACNDQVYSLILSCWDKSPGNRPHFSEIVMRIDNLLLPLASYMEFNFSD